MAQEMDRRAAEIFKNMLRTDPPQNLVELYLDAKFMADGCGLPQFMHGELVLMAIAAGCKIPRVVLPDPDEQAIEDEAEPAPAPAQKVPASAKELLAAGKK